MGNNNQSHDPTLGNILGAWESIVTNEYIRGVKEYGWQPFDHKLWQRDYYEHIIRNDADLDRIREYIVNNPANWGNDDNHPTNARNT
jgi:REP element-mobilizing transposase RayT